MVNEYVYECTMYDVRRTKTISNPYHSPWPMVIRFTLNGSNSIKFSTYPRIEPKKKQNTNTQIEIKFPFKAEPLQKAKTMEYGVECWKSITTCNINMRYKCSNSQHIDLYMIFLLVNFVFRSNGNGNSKFLYKQTISYRVHTFSFNLKALLDFPIIHSKTTLCVHTNIMERETDKKA